MGELTKAVIAAPIVDVGDVVGYVDRHNRLQRGEVRAIEATWRWGAKRKPLIIYELAHPTYHNRRFYATADCFAGPAARALVKEGETR